MIRVLFLLAVAMFEHWQDEYEFEDKIEHVMLMLGAITIVLVLLAS